jgi:hypothetical protein
MAGRIVLTDYDKERFFRYVKVGSSDECWEWTGGRIKKGYGNFHTQERHNVMAHRVSYTIYFGDPGDKHVLHTCDNPPCQNPYHFRLGTNKDNVDDMVSKKRHTIGTRNGMSKLTEEQVLEIREATESQSTIGARYGISQSHVSQIKRRVIWADLERT